MDDRYVLTMDRETALMVRRASEFYTRIMCGQFDEVVREILNAWPEKYKEDTFCIMRDQAEAFLRLARAVLFPELDSGSYYGVGHNRNADISWNVNQVIRYVIAWRDNPEGDYGVNFNKPISWSGTPLPSFEIVDSEHEEANTNATK